MKEEVLLYKVEDVVEFYINFGVIYGIVMDYIIFDYESDNVKVFKIVDECLEECLRRVEFNLENVFKFFYVFKSEFFIFYGVVYGWSFLLFVDFVYNL